MAIPLPTTSGSTSPAGMSPTRQGPRWTQTGSVTTVLPLAGRQRSTAGLSAVDDRVIPQVWRQFLQASVRRRGEAEGGPPARAVLWVLADGQGRLRRRYRGELRSSLTAHHDPQGLA